MSSNHLVSCWNEIRINKKIILAGSGCKQSDVQNVALQNIAEISERFFLTDSGKNMRGGAFADLSKV